MSMAYLRNPMSVTCALVAHRGKLDGATRNPDIIAAYFPLAKLPNSWWLVLSVMSHDKCAIKFDVI